MTLLNFCKLCGDKRVRDVKAQLEELFKRNKIDPSMCGICCNVVVMNEGLWENQQNNGTQRRLPASNIVVDGKDESDMKRVSDMDTDETDTRDSDQDVDLEEASDQESNESDEGSNYSDEVNTDLNRALSSKNMSKMSQRKSTSKKKSPVDPSELDSNVQDMILVESTMSNSLSCKICQKSFRRSARGVRSFVNHISSHTGQEPISKPYKCPECQYQFKNNCSLKNHMKSHRKVKMQECPYPECNFKAKRSMKKHVDVIHRGIKKKAQKKKHICQICGRVLEYGRSLKKHLMRHEGLKPCKCDECGKCFLDTTNLARHQQRHKEVKDTICEICGKSFHTMSDLKGHLVSHTDNRIYQCEFCPYRAKRLGTLKNHKRNIHTESDRDKCKCTYCGLTFVSAGACTKHEKKHQGGLELAEALLKPYQCQDCGYRATKPCKVRIHRRVHTGEKPFNCAHCEKAFTQMGQCNKHMRICKQR